MKHRQSNSTIRLTASVLALTACGLSGGLRADEPVVSSGRPAIDQKGSLLIYSYVEVKWDATGTVLKDTYLQLLNDYAGEVRVQMYFVNGDEPLDAVYSNSNPPQLLERAHEGWNWVDTQFSLTQDQATYWAASTGQPQGVPNWAILDPGNPRGRPDLDVSNPGGRVIRGYLLGWAVDNLGREIRWNHLSGNAVVVDYRDSAAAEYPAWAFQAHSAPHGQQTISCLAFSLESGQCIESSLLPGQLDLDGFEYDNPPSKLVFQFTADGSIAHNASIESPEVAVNTDLIVFPVGVDLRQDTDGPITTKAKYDIWNENEVRFSGTERCITCWDKTAMAAYTIPPIPNHFLESLLQTATGKARVGGLGSTVCVGPNGASQDAAILGMTYETHRFTNGVDTTAAPMVIQGDDTATIRFDLVEPPQEANGGD